MTRILHLQLCNFPWCARLVARSAEETNPSATDDKGAPDASPYRCDGWQTHPPAPRSAWAVADRAWPEAWRHIPADPEIRKRHQSGELQPAIRDVRRAGSADRLFLHGFGKCRSGVGRCRAI